MVVCPDADMVLIAVGIILDRLFNWSEGLLDAYRLKKKYKFLARKYRLLRDGITPTGGSIELIQNNNGTFKTIAYNPDGTIEWEGQLQMSADDENTGTGSYHYLALSANHGTQTVMYVPAQDHLHFIGINQSTTAHAEFVHVWDPLIRRGKTLT